MNFGHALADASGALALEGPEKHAATANVTAAIGNRQIMKRLLKSGADEGEESSPIRAELLST